MILSKNGLTTYSFKTKREGSEYEYDAVVPWGNYLFVFECKNRALPNANPIQEHYFDLETSDNLKQLNRLVDAFERFTDILRDNLPACDVEKIVVPILLNCLTYSFPGKLGSVYFYDFSALSRFFKNGQIVGHRMRIGNGTSEVARGPRLWRGESPTAEDLIAQLETPIQFQVVRDSLSVDESGFPLPPETWVFSEDFQRIPIKSI